MTADLAGRKYATERDRVICEMIAAKRITRRIYGDTLAPTGTWEVLHVRQADVPAGHLGGVDADDLLGHFIITRTPGLIQVGTFDKGIHAEDESEHLAAKFEKWVNDDSPCERCNFTFGKHGGDCTLYGMADRKAEHKEQGEVN